MKATICLALAFLATLALAGHPDFVANLYAQPCDVPSATPIPDKVLRPRNYSANVPDQWSWSDYDGTGRNLLTLVKNQHVPQYCGSCWASTWNVAAIPSRINKRNFNLFTIIFDFWY